MGANTDIFSSIYMKFALKWLNFSLLEPLTVSSLICLNLKDAVDEVAAYLN